MPSTAKIVVITPSIFKKSISMPQMTIIEMKYGI